MTEGLAGEAAKAMLDRLCPPMGAGMIVSGRLVFNIKGNDDRLVVAVAYRFAARYIKFVGTHAQYDAIDAATVENQP